MPLFRRNSLYYEDNENHRINECVLYAEYNRLNSSEKIDFGEVYSDRADVAKPIIDAILSLWDLKHGKNKMRGPPS